MSETEFFVQLILSIAISVAVAAPLAFFMSKKLTQWSEKKRSIKS
ncbi:MAG: hypothetical protein ACLTD8_14025 [Acutalibacteraceae bacterium]